MGKKKRAEGGGNIADAIMSDLMMQMLTFFILLYTIAALNLSKSRVEGDSDSVVDQIRQGFRQRLNMEEGTPTPKNDPIIQVQEAKVEDLETEQKAQLITKIKEIVEKETLRQYIEVIVEEQKIRLVFNQPVLFNSGYAYLKPGAKDYLDPVISGIINTIENDIIIEGHTDSMPIKNEMYQDNWQLSFDRAYNVLKYMVDVHKIDPFRVSAVGYGQYRPRVDNDTYEKRAINRRIEVNILLHSKKIDSGIQKNKRKSTDVDSDIVIPTDIEVPI
ncbi:MAG: flagellar motor protein MotB [Candidatus Margulisbacteria bacterium]|nr:flagellar motor protein MotB [Candidatus Margulisiibacteriota bacterium]